MQVQTMALADFETRLRAAQPGDQITYHTGRLLLDRLVGLRSASVDNTAGRAWEAMEAGHVHLAQRKLAQEVYEYIAIKRPKPYKKVLWLGAYAPWRFTHDA